MSAQNPFNLDVNVARPAAAAAPGAPARPTIACVTRYICTKFNCRPTQFPACITQTPIGCM